MPYTKNGKYYGSVTGKQITKRQYQRRTRTIKAGKYLYNAARISYKLARLANVEKKYIDATSTSTAVSTTGTIVSLSDIPQGDTVNHRHGDSVKPQGLTIRLKAVANSSAVSTQLRVVIFRMKHENGTTPTIANLFDGTSSLYYLAPKAWDNRFHSKILYDRVLNLSDDRSQGAFRKIYLKLTGHINWQAGTTTGEDGELYMALVSNETTNTPNVAYYSRLTFTDN